MLIYMSRTKPYLFLFLNRNVSAVPAGESFLNCMIVLVFSGSFADSFAKVLNFIENPTNDLVK